MQILCIEVVYNDLDLRKWAAEANWTSFSGPVWDLLMKVDNSLDTDRIAGCITNYINFFREIVVPLRTIC